MERKKSRVERHVAYTCGRAARSTAHAGSVLPPSAITPYHYNFYSGSLNGCYYFIYRLPVVVTLFYMYVYGAILLYL
jgi:hypothetical protein